MGNKCKLFILFVSISAGAKEHDGGPGSAGEELPHKEGGTSSSGDAELQGFNQKHRRVWPWQVDILSGQTVFYYWCQKVRKLLL